MSDMMDLDDHGMDADRHSRRDRWKDAFVKTKIKLRKEKAGHTQAEFKLSDDVNDFLAAGRKPVINTTSTPVSDELRCPGIFPHRLSSSDSLPSPPTSPLRIAVPRLDISQTRWPNSRPVGMSPQNLRSHSDVNLAPSYGREPHGRSYSFNSALKKGSKPRGLNVAFDKSAPAIIGEGGDASEVPTVEISIAKRQRARSLSPYIGRIGRPSSKSSNSSSTQSPRRKPVPSPSPTRVATNTNVDRQDSFFQPTPIRRVQTEFSKQDIEAPYSNQEFSRQLETALHLEEYDDPHSPHANPPNLPTQPPGRSKRPRNTDRAQPIYSDCENRDNSSTIRNGSFGLQPYSTAPSDEMLPMSSPQASHRGQEQQDFHQYSIIASSYDRPGPELQQSAQSTRHISSRTTPQHQHQRQHQHYRPDLQSSQQTSIKPPPPKVANFYANVSKPKLEDSPSDVRNPFMQHLEQLQHTRQSPSTRTLLGQNAKHPSQVSGDQSRTTLPYQGASAAGWI